MISIVVPTLNRAYILRKTLPLMFEQEHVGEIILVSDAGTDDTEQVFREIASDYPSVRARFVRNDVRSGAAFSRNRGADLATRPFVLFCDDDVCLEPGYGKRCLERMKDPSVAVVSGRIVYMQDGESHAKARERFERNLHREAPFNYLLCELVNMARVRRDTVVPFTHGIFLTRNELLRKFPFDPFYRKGNGYREESDFQMNMTVKGYNVVLTPEAHCFHLPMAQVATGGQRRPKHQALDSMLRHNAYFYDKYFDQYRRRFGIRTPASLAKGLFAAFAVYRVYMERQVNQIGRRVLDLRRAFGVYLTVEALPVLTEAVPFAAMVA